MSRTDRLYEMFGTERPDAMRLRQWLRELRLADAFWTKHPRERDIKRLNYDMDVAQRALADLGGSGV